MKPQHKMLKDMDDRGLKEWIADLQALLHRAEMEQRRRQRKRIQRAEESANEARMRQAP